MDNGKPTFPAPVLVKGWEDQDRMDRSGQTHPDCEEVSLNAQ